MILVIDTSAYSRFRQDDASAMAVAGLFTTLVVTPIMLGELAAGFVGGNQAKRNRQNLDDFLAARHIIRAVLTVKTSEHYAAIWDELRRAGKAVPQNDIWIAAIAREHRLAVWTYDQHFDFIGGLKVVRTPQDMGNP